MTAHFLILFSAAAAGSLVSAIWEGTVLATCVALCLRLAKGITAGVRSVLWTAVLLLVVLLHFVPFVGRGAASQSDAGKLLHVDLRWSVAIVALWALFSLFRGMQLIHSAVGLRRIAGRASPVAASPACAPLLRSGWRSAQLCVSADVDRPSVIGFFRPRVLIPQALLEDIAPAELEQIVLHEMEHLRRADDWTNLLQKISLVLFPLNPVLVWVERRLCIERELACDDRVLRVTKARKAYATCLVNLAEHSVLRRSATLVLGAWERQSELGRRVHRILLPDVSVMGRRRMRLVTGALILGMIGGVATLAREPQLISFAPAAGTASETAIGISESPQFASAAFHERSASLTSTPQSAPKMVDTLFREPASADASHPVKASARKLHRAAAPAISLPDAAKPQFMSRRVVMHRTQPAAAGWMMLTDWSDAPQIPEMRPPQVRLLVSTTDQRTYAAIQMMNGWLVIQL
jgi:hypothetical protein